MNLEELKKATKAVKAVIKNKNVEVLFLQRNPKKSGIDNWDFPGGLIESGEDEVDALKRECQEELNVKIKILKPGKKWKFFRDLDQQWVDVQNYEAEIVDGEIKLSDEHIDFQWVKIEDVEKYSVKDKSFFQALQNKNIFDIWNELKKEINFKKKYTPVKLREIWWLSVGENIGAEQNGKNKFFERPVLVVKVFSKKFFVGIPLTSGQKNEKSNYYFKIPYQGKNYFLILPQIRIFSTQRVQRIVRKLDVETFQDVKKKLKNILNL